jgi:hypothetical protein
MAPLSGSAADANGNSIDLSLSRSVYHPGIRSASGHVYGVRPQQAAPFFSAPLPTNVDGRSRGKILFAVFPRRDLPKFSPILNSLLGKALRRVLFAEGKSPWENGAPSSRRITHCGARL